MKKLVAILVVFAMIAGAAFALDLSAGVTMRVTLIEGNSEYDTTTPYWGGEDKWPRSGWDGWWWLGGKKTNDENTAGAAFSFAADALSNDGKAFYHNDDNWAVGWWRPLDQIYFAIGKTGEGGVGFAGADMCAWGYQSNDLLISPEFNYYNGYAGSLGLNDGHGFFDPGDVRMQLSIMPIDMIKLHFGWDPGGEFTPWFAHNIAIQLAVAIPGAGEAAVGFKSAPINNEKQIAVQYTQSIDAIKFELGFKTWFNPDNSDFKAPIHLGLGFRYGSPWGDTFWLSARVAASIPTEDDGTTLIGFGICPSYDLGIFRVYCPIDITIGLPSEGDSVFAWSINPYIRKEMGGIEFWAGVQLYSGVNGYINGSVFGTASDAVWYPLHVKDAVNWAIPIAILWAW